MAGYKLLEVGTLPVQAIQSREPYWHLIAPPFPFAKAPCCNQSKAQYPGKEMHKPGGRTIGEIIIKISFKTKNA